MQKKFIAAIIGIGLICSGIPSRADIVGPAKYELYSWKSGDEWSYSILPVSKKPKEEADIRQAASTRGTDLFKEKLLAMKEGDVISWLERPESKIIYPPSSVLQDVLDYAQTVGVIIVVDKSAKRSLTTP